jgi:hypothetical protein
MGSNKFWLMVVISPLGNVIDVTHYSRLRDVKGQRTRLLNNGYYQPKVFECLYGLGCITATEVDFEQPVQA